MVWQWCRLTRRDYVMNNEIDVDVVHHLDRNGLCVDWLNLRRGPKYVKPKDCQMRTSKSVNVGFELYSQHIWGKIKPETELSRSAAIRQSTETTAWFLWIQPTSEPAKHTAKRLYR